jgi:hypothetical protein
MHRPSRRLLQAIVIALIIVVPQLAFAGSYRLDQTEQASAVSPYSATCGLAPEDPNDPAASKLYLNSEVEPWIDVTAVDRNDDGLADMAGSYQQDRWSDGGARGNVASVSFDGGETWAQSIIPGISECSGGEFDRASDPWLSFSPDGSLHHVSLSFDVAGTDTTNAIIVNKSEDGGLTWSAPKVIRRDERPTVFNDKETITADPNDSRFVYVIWDRLVFPRGERASFIASLRAGAFAGPVWFSRSTDGGETYEPAHPIFDPGTINQTIGNQIVVLPDNAQFQGDELINIMNLIQNVKKRATRGFNVAVLRSPNRGVTWSGPIRIDKMIRPGIDDPEDGRPVRTGDLIPEIAVDPNTGQLYAVWQDERFTGFDAVALSTSTDGGRTWTEAVRVDRTPLPDAGEPAGNRQAFTPSVDIAQDGTVAVTYYDFRNNTADGGATLPTDYFIVHCDPSATVDCSKRANYGNELRLTNTSFDMRKAPFARGFFTGDYEGLADDGRDFSTFFSQSHGTDPASVFFRRACPADAASRCTD